MAGGDTGEREFERHRSNSRVVDVCFRPFSSGTRERVECAWDWDRRVGVGKRARALLEDETLTLTIRFAIT